jgi:hypothetical protein
MPVLESRRRTSSRSERRLRAVRTRVHRPGVEDLAYEIVTVKLFLVTDPAATFAFFGDEMKWLRPPVL